MKNNFNTVSVSSIDDAIFFYLKMNEKPVSEIDFKFLTPEEIFNFMNVECNSKNLENFFKAINGRINHLHNKKKFTDVKHFAEAYGEKYLKFYKNCTGKRYILNYFNGYELELSEFHIGDKFIFGDGSFSIDYSVKVNSKSYKTDVNRELERDAEFEIISEPYWANYTHDFGGGDKEVNCYRFVDVISLKTGIPYRMLAVKYSNSIVSSENLDKTTSWWD